VADEVDRQMYDENQIRAELMQLEFDVEEGRIDEQEQREREDELLERLAVAQSRNRGTQELEAFDG
jgi:hypothetical protein